MLVAAEWPIYGRYGYGMAVEAAGHGPRRVGGPVPRASTSDGSVELVDAETLLELAPRRSSTGIGITSPGAITLAPSGNGGT